MSVSSSAYRRLVAEYRRVLLQMRALNARGGTGRAAGRRALAALRPALRLLAKIIRLGGHVWVGRRLCAIRGAAIVRRATGSGGGAATGAGAWLRIMVEPLPSRMMFAAVPAGPDFLVNQTLAGIQQDVDVAMSANGSSVAVWDDEDRGIYGRRYDAAGNAVGNEFRVAAGSGSAQGSPAAAMDDAGNFAVAWVEDASPSPRIEARLFSANGSARTGDLIVKNGLSAATGTADVAMDDDGDIVVVWSGAGATDSDGVHYQRLLADGTFNGAAARLNDLTAGTQDQPAIAIKSGAAFVAAFTDRNGHDTVYANRYGTHFAAHAAATGVNEHAAAVDMDAAGNFAVAWVGKDADREGVRVRRFDAAASPLGPEVLVNAAYDVGDQGEPALAMAADGQFVVAWSSENQDGDGEGIYAQHFAADGTRAGGEFRVNDDIDDPQIVPSVAWNGSGPALFAWQGKLGTGDAADIVGRRFRVGAISNAAPVNTVPAAQTTAEDVPLYFSSANGNAITVADVDGEGLRVTLSVPSGTLTLSRTTGLTFTAGDGAADATMTFAGSLADVNAALEGMRYDPLPNGTGTATGQIITNDRSALPGGPLSDTDAVAITVTPVNDAPVNAVPAAQQIDEDASLVFSGANGNRIAIADTDAGGDHVAVTLGVSAGTLTLPSQAGLTVTGGTGIADQTMTVTGPVSAINAALDGLTYAPPADANGPFTLTVTSDDQGNSGTGGAMADADAVTIVVAAVNDAPVNHLPPGQSVNGGGLLFSSSVGSAISISDVDAGASPVQMALSASTGTLSLAQTAGLTFTRGDGSDDAAMTFRGTLAAINVALEGMSYQPPLLFLGTADIDVVTNDLGNSGAGGARADSDTLSVGVTHPNAAPANAVPATQNMREDENLVFSSAGGNRISIADADAGGGVLKVTLAATSGTLTLSNDAGLTYVTGDGSADASMSFAGTLADLNNALNAVVFSPAANFHGAATVAVTTDDQGNSGTGGARSDTDAITVNVAAVADAPTISDAATAEDAQTTAGLVVSRSAADGAEVTHFKVTAVAGGTLFLNDGVTPVNAGGFITVAQGGAGLRFTPAPNATADGHVTVRAATAGRCRPWRRRRHGHGHDQPRERPARRRQSPGRPDGHRGCRLRVPIPRRCVCRWRCHRRTDVRRHAGRRRAAAGLAGLRRRHALVRRHPRRGGRRNVRRPRDRR